MKEEKSVKKITCAISEECDYDLDVLASLMKISKQKAMQFVLEKHTSGNLERFISKRIKSSTTNVEE